VAFYGSVLPAAWSLMLALRASGLGTTWTTLLVAEERRVAEALGIPEDVTQTILLPVAWTRDAVLRKAQRKSADQVTYWNGWARQREP
jgi:nitroreductase